MLLTFSQLKEQLKVIYHPSNKFSGRWYWVPFLMIKEIQYSGLFSREKRSLYWSSPVHLIRKRPIIPKKINNDEGVILLTVIMLTIVLSIVAIGIMSVNVSQVRTSQSVVDSIKAEQLAMGVFYLCHQALSEGVACPSSIVETMDGKTFNAVVIPYAPGSGLSGTTEYDFAVEYNYY